MGQLPYRALIVDFDRTLLHTDKTLSAYSIRVLRDWQEEGACLFAATARPERAVTDYCRKLAFDAVTTLNGARTITPNAVFEHQISTDSAEFILEQLSSIPGSVISVEAETGLYASADIPDWAPKVTDRITDLPRKERIYKILASHPQIPADKIKLRLPEDTYCSIADRKLVQIMSRTATKWSGVRKMLEAYQIDTDQAIYFGDDNDDIEPIRQCGCGVAVSNALDCVREIADYVTGSNDEDGVANFLSKLRNGENGRQKEKEDPHNHGTV